MRRALTSLALGTLGCLALSAPAQAAEAVTNGGFESGVTGWTFTAAGVCTSPCGATPHSGSAWAVLGGGSDPDHPLSAPASLTQSVAITGTPATLSFYVRVRLGTAGNMATLQPTLDGSPIGSAISSTDGALANWTSKVLP